MTPFPSTLIICQNDKKIISKIEEICQSIGHNSVENNPDIFLINQDSGWSIELIRSVKKFLSQKPFNHQNKVVIIHQAHNLNIESQNAILKILEEPGKDNFVIISTNKPSKLLPTISSRCSRLKITSSVDNNFNNPSLEISSDIKKNLAQSEKISKDKTQVLPFLEEQLKIYQQLLTKDPSAKNCLVTKKIIKAIQMINANVDPKSALDFIFLS